MSRSILSGVPGNHLLSPPKKNNEWGFNGDSSRETHFFGNVPKQLPRTMDPFLGSPTFRVIFGAGTRRSAPPRSFSEAKGAPSRTESGHWPWRSAAGPKSSWDRSPLIKVTQRVVFSCHLWRKNDRPPCSEGFLFEGAANFLTKGGKKTPPRSRPQMLGKGKQPPCSDLDTPQKPQK